MERRCALEEEVVRIDIVHEDDVASTHVLRTRQALADARTPDTAGRRCDEQGEKDDRQPQLPRRLDRCLPMKEMALPRRSPPRSEEHTSELQSRTVISYAVFCLKKKKKIKKKNKIHIKKKKKKKKKN